LAPRLSQGRGVACNACHTVIVVVVVVVVVVALAAYCFALAIAIVNACNTTLALADYRFALALAKTCNMIWTLQNRCLPWREALIAVDTVVTA
jgi:hypothetical protein